jgi:HSP20 family protein
MGPDEKKKKKSHDDDDNPEEENKDEFNFPFGDDFFNMLGKQFSNIFKNLPPEFGGGNVDFTSDEFKKTFAEIMRQMQNMDPEELNKMMAQFQNMNPEMAKKMFGNMDPEMVKKMFGDRRMFGNKAMPFVFGVNMRMGPDGKPIFDSFGNVKKKQKGEGEPEIKPDRDPLVDVYEEDDKLVVVMEVPGVEKDQIEIKATSNELEVFAESSDKTEYPRKYHTTVPLPKEINPDFAKARYQNGILEVRLTKAGEKQEKRKINID